MLILKTSYALAFLASGVCAIAAVIEFDPIFLGAAVAAFISASCVVALDRIVSTLSAASIAPTGIPDDAPELAEREPVSVSPAPNADDLEKRIAAAKSRNRA